MCILNDDLFPPCRYGCPPPRPNSFPTEARVFFSCVMYRTQINLFHVTFFRPKVNVVVVVDGSGSILADDWILQQQFAKDTVEAFARRNIFANGGTASYVQFGDSTYDEGTFDSAETFNAHVDAVNQSYYRSGIGTLIGAGT